MILPTGKGMFIWRIERIGSPAEIARQAKEAGFSHVLVKIADGTDYSEYPLVAELVKALHAVGIVVFGWQYVYLLRPSLEAETAAARCVITGCDGFVIDAEKECKSKPAEAAEYCERLTYLLPDNISIGLSSYRFPSYHPELPWDIFRGVCAYDAPQVYWERAHNPADQLHQSYTEFQKFNRLLPYIPTGAAYKTTYKLADGTLVTWKPTPDDIAKFVGALPSLGIQAYNFWEWYCAQTEVPELWPIITGIETPEPLPVIQRVKVTCTNGLNIRSTPSVATNIIGAAHYGGVWTVMGRVPCVLGEWVQIAPNAYIAGWLTVPVT